MLEGIASVWTVVWMPVYTCIHVTIHVSIIMCISYRYVCVCTGKLVYNAQSPDEAALVSAARNFGFVFVVRHERNVHYMSMFT